MKLFTPIQFREIELKNRIVVSPMCEYSAKNGLPQPWHLVHLGSRAVGGAALVITEATAVEPRGRISPSDTGLYGDEHVHAWKPITDFIRQQGAIPAVQLAHSGRKGSMAAPWLGEKLVPPSDGGWQTVSASALPFKDGYTLPHALSLSEIDGIVAAFRTAAQRALAAGFDIIEIHSAHGYLLHQFLSPLSNFRDDDYGGSLENRMRFPLRVAEAIREVWPHSLPLFFRISATDWVDGGWDVIQSVEYAKQLKTRGIDLIDCSSGGIVPGAKIPVSPGYQVQFADTIRKQAEIATGAVGMITEPQHADQILETEQADLVILARELLRDPYWPRRAAQTLNIKLKPPLQYERAW